MKTKLNVIVNTTEQDKQKLIDELGLNGQKFKYQEICEADARKEFCDPFFYKWKDSQKEWCSCGNEYNNHSCHKSKLIRENVSKTTTPLPYGVLLKLKEAVDMKIFDSFEIWRPENDAEKKERLEKQPTFSDPWIVGIFNNKSYLICGWK